MLTIWEISTFQNLELSHAKINDIKKSVKDVVILSLRMPPNSDFNFITYQYIDIIGPKGVKRSYSIANYSNNQILELHIKKFKMENLATIGSIKLRQMIY